MLQALDEVAREGRRRADRGQPDPRVRAAPALPLLAAHQRRQGADPAERDPAERDLTYTESAALAKEQEEAFLYRAMQSRHRLAGAAPARLGAGALGPADADPQRRASPPICKRDLAPVYTVWGDEPLLAQEAGDAIRAAARAAGCSERQVHTVAGAHFDWSGLLGASQALSLFADRQLVEIRIPSGKPGKDGSEALQRYCERRSPAAAATSSRWSSCRGSTGTQQ